MSDATVPASSHGPRATSQASAEAETPAAPVIGLSERNTGAPYPLLKAVNPTIGWYFRCHADGGAAYAVLRRESLGPFEVVESFPLNEDGWSRAWRSFAGQSPTAVPEALAALKSRQDKAAREDVERGLVLLALQAQAADRRPSRRAGGWIKRRVEQLEILDTRAVRWRVGIDFEVPLKAPVVLVGSEEFRLIPLTTLPKGDLVSFDLRDEYGKALWLPTSDETNLRFGRALVVTARRILKLTALPGRLEQELMRIVARPPSEHKEEYRPFAAAADRLDINVGSLEKKVHDAPSWLDWWQARRALAAASAKKRAAEKALGNLNDDVRNAVCQLMTDLSFRNLLEELAHNYIVHVAILAEPMDRRIIKMKSERRVTFWPPRKSRLRRLLQSLGWRCWPLDVLIGGGGGSHHLEVAAPTGVDIVRIVARPTYTDRHEPNAPVLRTSGFSPHVHIRIPATSPFRYRATIHVRTSRSGWLFASLLVGIVIAVVMVLGRLNLAALFKISAGAASAEAGTAATLLLALLGAVATWLTRPGEHPLASRLLLLVRGLMLLDVAAVLTGTGDLVLHQATSPGQFTTTLWSVLAYVATFIALMLSVSWLMPRKLLWRTGNRDRARLCFTQRRSRQMTKSVAEPDRGALSIPAVDGYRYADRHPWTASDQSQLTDDLWNTVSHFLDSHEALPVFDAEDYNS